MAIALLGLVGLIGWADYASGWELDASMAFALPIVVVVFRFDRGAGFALAVLCALVWWLARIEIHPYHTGWGFPLALAVRFFFFSAVAVAAAAVKAQWTLGQRAHRDARAHAASRAGNPPGERARAAAPRARAARRAVPDAGRHRGAELDAGAPAVETLRRRSERRRRRDHPADERRHRRGARPGARLAPSACRTPTYPKRSRVWRSPSSTGFASPAPSIATTPFHGSTTWSRRTCCALRRRP